MRTQGATVLPIRTGDPAYTEVGYVLLDYFLKYYCLHAVSCFTTAYAA